MFMVGVMTNITVDWLDADQYALCLTFRRGWTWDDFYLAHETAFAMVREHPAEFVDLVYHFESQGTLPKGYYTHLLRTGQSYPGKVGMVLWVGCHPVVVELVRNITRYHKDLAQYYAFLDTLEEAAQVVGP